MSSRWMQEQHQGSAYPPYYQTWPQQRADPGWQEPSPEDEQQADADPWVAGQHFTEAPSQGSGGYQEQQAPRQSATGYPEPWAPGQQDRTGYQDSPGYQGQWAPGQPGGTGYPEP